MTHPFDRLAYAPGAPGDQVVRCCPSFYRMSRRLSATSLQRLDDFGQDGAEPGQCGVRGAHGVPPGGLDELDLARTAHDCPYGAATPSARCLRAWLIASKLTWMRLTVLGGKRVKSPR